MHIRIHLEAGATNQINILALKPVGHRQDIVRQLTGCASVNINAGQHLQLFAGFAHSFFAAQGDERIGAPENQCANITVFDQVREQGGWQLGVA
ncbi:hypothetical protein D3C76_1285210 [compost metagenome]